MGGALFAASGAGCGSSSSSTGTGGKTSSSSSTSTSSSSHGSTSTSSSGMGGSTSSGVGGKGGAGGGTTNHDFAHAADIKVNDMNATMGSLTDPTNTSDFYKFMGKKDESIGFITAAKTLIMGGDAFDPTVVDLVINIYDGKMNMIAQQDDPWPRNSNDPFLQTLLPADDTYYIEVAECNKAFGSGCADPMKLATFDYTLQVVDLGGPGDTPEGMTDSPATPGMSSPAVKYPKSGMPAAYGVGLLDGTFKDTMDVDTYVFKVPADVTVGMAGERAHIEMWLQSTGSNDGNGSSANAKYWIEDAAKTGTTLALVDQSNYGDNDNIQNGMNNGPALLSVPVVPGNTYNIYVQHGGASKMSAEKNDFYYTQLFAGSFFFGTVEKEITTMKPNSNDTLMNAETVAASNTNKMTKAVLYAVDGELPAGDVADFFEFDVPAGLTKLSVQCEAARIGSGLTGFTAELQDGTGKAVTGTSLVDSAKQDVHTDFQKPPAIPNGATKLYLKTAATGQDANVAGSHYRCFVGFDP